VTGLVEGAVPALLVEIDGHAFGIVDPKARPLETVPTVTPVPLAPRALAGLAQVDGEVLPVLWPGDGIRVAAAAILTETQHGRVILLCGRILADEAASRATVLPLDTLVESIRQAIRA
jgi:chemotaxis signal transduction protein